MKTSLAQDATPQPATPDLGLDNQKVEAMSLPLAVSTLICTRNREDSIANAVRSVLACTYADMELIVVDQSTSDATKTALAPFLNDSRLRYIRSAMRGKSNALNVGIRAATHEIIVITDDDCEVEPNWPLAHAQVFRDNPEVAITYGNVLARAYDQSEGFTPVYVVKKDFLCRSVWQKLIARGIGANMAIRREAFLRVGGFDASLGPGGRFAACEDGDYTVRCLLAGYQVYETGGSTVMHYGFRTWEQGRQLTRDAFLGIGAAYIKPIKCGRLSVVPLLVFEFLRYALFPSLWATITFRKPTNWQRVHFFLRGMMRGLRVPADRATLLYRPESAAEPIPSAETL